MSTHGPGFSEDASDERHPDGGGGGGESESGGGESESGGSESSSSSESGGEHSGSESSSSESGGGEHEGGESGGGEHEGGEGEGEHESTTDAVVETVAKAGEALAKGSEKGKSTTEKIAEAAEAVNKGVEALEGAKKALESANEQYKKVFGSDSGLLQGLGHTVESLQGVGATLKEQADKLKEDAKDLAGVFDSSKEVGEDVATTAKDSKAAIGSGQKLLDTKISFSSPQAFIASVKELAANAQQFQKDATKVADDVKKAVKDVKETINKAKEAGESIYERHFGGHEKKEAEREGITTRRSEGSVSYEDSELDESDSPEEEGEEEVLDHERFVVHLHVSAYDDDEVDLEEGDLFVSHMQGHAAISQLFEYELTLIAKDREHLDFDTIDALLKGTATISWGPEGEHKVHGVFRAIESVLEEHNVAAQYRAFFVPRMWALTQSTESTVYQHKTAVEILIAILKEHAMGVEDEDFEVRIPEWSDKKNQFYKKYPPREYTVQYMETEMNFVSRLLEHEGICFFFEHEDGKDKLIIADANEAFPQLEHHEVIAFKSAIGTTVTKEQVLALNRRKEVVPRKVHVRDYNYRTPKVDIHGESQADKTTGVGSQFMYAEHARTPGEAKKYARIRAEEIKIRRAIFTGRCVVRGLRPGIKFTLDGHPNPAMDVEYVVTTVTQSVDQHPESSASTDQSRSSPFTCEFTAVPYDSKDAPYRPQRIAVKPRIVGLIHGRIDQLEGAGDLIPAPIDDQGRYKVVLPFDNEDAGVGKATRWIRMAQPYSGIHYGMHFPLHVGAEVMIAHVDGDPDRPVILGSPPNPVTVSPVTNEDATRSRIVTRSNLRMVWRDRTGAEGAGEGGGEGGGEGHGAEH